MILVYIPLQGYLGAGVSAAFQVCAGVDAWLLYRIICYVDHHLLFGGCSWSKAIACNYCNSVDGCLLAIEIQVVRNHYLAAVGVYLEFGTCLLQGVGHRIIGVSVGCRYWVANRGVLVGKRSSDILYQRSGDAGTAVEYGNVVDISGY